METKNTLLGQFQKIQSMQFKLDELKKKKREVDSEIRSIGQKIPQLLRELNLK